MDLGLIKIKGTNSKYCSKFHSVSLSSIPGGANISATFEQQITPYVFEESKTDPDFQVAIPVPRITDNLSVSAIVIPQPSADIFTCHQIKRAISTCHN